MLGMTPSTRRYLDVPQPIVLERDLDLSATAYGIQNYHEWLEKQTVLEQMTAWPPVRRIYRGHIRKGLWTLGVCWFEALAITGQLQPGMSGLALWQVTGAVCLVVFGVLSTEYLPMNVEEAI